MKHTLTADQKTYISNLYAMGATQSEIAHHMNMGATTVRRILAEFGSVTYSSYTTPKERTMLSLLKGVGITTPTQLSKMLQGSP